MEKMLLMDKYPKRKLYLVGKGWLCMERVASDEERIRRAEEIYYKRRAQGVRVASTSVNVGETRKVSLGKKMMIQILVCVIIYIILQIFYGYSNMFSENVKNEMKAILNYDVNFQELYNQFVEYFNKNFNIINNINSVKQAENSETVNSEENVEKSESISENASGEANASDNANDVNNEGQINNEEAQSINYENEASETSQNSVGSETNDIAPSTGNDGTQKAKLDSENKVQMEQDAEYIKQNCNLIQPIKGIITSNFGSREETEIVSAFHQGIDIAANIGTPICAAMEGTVVAASYAGDYGNHIKIQNGEVLTVYAHCSELEVNVGDYVNQNQEIGKVGATGKVTGPHLHFEIRRDGRYVNPELILSF